MHLYQFVSGSGSGGGVLTVTNDWEDIFGRSFRVAIFWQNYSKSLLKFLFLFKVLKNHQKILKNKYGNTANKKRVKSSPMV